MSTIRPCVRFRAVLTNISVVDNPWGEKLVRLELTDERELPGPVVAQRGSNEVAREIVPIVAQIIRSMPGFTSRVRVPRLTVYLTEDEWERLVRKPNIGDVIEVEFSGERVEVRPSGPRGT